MIKRRKVIAVDVDATLAKYDGWKGVNNIGDPISGALEFVRKLSKFADILIYSTRTNSELNKLPAEKLRDILQVWLDKWGFTYNDIWIGQGKPICDAIVDDRGVSCRPQEDEQAYNNAVIKCMELCSK